MKVYELMNTLASLPSGADIMCSAALTVSELESGNPLGEDENDEMLYAVSKELKFIDSEKDTVCLEF